ncbi:MAG TPA: hypothetical protein VIC28_07950, partial [Thermoanaerobaculia bacterium]
MTTFLPVLALRDGEVHPSQKPAANELRIAAAADVPQPPLLAILLTIRDVRRAARPRVRLTAIRVGIVDGIFAAIEVKVHAGA